MKLLGLLVALLFLTVQCIPSDDVAYLEHFFNHHTSAHDIIVNQKVLLHGSEQSFFDEFYQVAHYVMSNYQRPLLLIDVMPEYGYCPFKLMSALNATAIFLMTDVVFNDGVKKSDIVNRLGTVCGVSDRLLVLDHSLDPLALRYISDCEHCDVVLINNILKLCGSQWKELYSVLFALGETVIMGMASDGVCPDMYREACEFFDARGGGLMKTIEKDDYEARFYVFFQKKESVKKCVFNDAKPHPPHVIQSNFYKKVFIKDSVERPWYNGINLLTFRALHGVVPSEDYILDRLEELAPFAPKGADTIIEGKNLLVLP